MLLFWINLTREHKLTSYQILSLSLSLNLTFTFVCGAINEGVLVWVVLGFLYNDWRYKKSVKREKEREEEAA